MKTFRTVHVWAVFAALSLFVAFRALTPATSVAHPHPAAPAASPAAPQQYPIMDKVADKVIQKYQTSSCEQLWQERATSKSKPKSTQEAEAISILRNDPKMRAAFIDKIAAPIANKMFECGMIP